MDAAPKASEDGELGYVAVPAEPLCSEFYVVFSPRGLRAIVLGAAAFEHRWAAVVRHAPSHPLARRVSGELGRYFRGERVSFTVPLDPAGATPFRLRVWGETARIPHGSLDTYGGIAERLGGRRYARAVGAALGSNPVPVVVPCHRVVAARDRGLGGYGLGLEVKRKLLELEGVAVEC